MGREERHYFDPWQDVYFPRGSKKSVRLPSFTDGRRSMQLEIEWLQRRRPDGSRPSSVELSLPPAPVHHRICQTSNE